jgi:Staphylococcal nuclease homologue
VCASVAAAAAVPLEAYPKSGETFMVGACKLETIGPDAVSAIVDARTILLKSGRQARLAGIEIGAPERNFDELNAMLVGRSVIMRRIGPEEDRYGRLLVHLFVGDGKAERWLQADLIERGSARVAGRVGDVACARELLAREANARRSKLGVWAEADGIKAADSPAALAAERGRFVLVEGNVLSVRTSGNTIFINFGRKWTEDFAVTIAKRHERAFAAAGVAPNALQGRRVRVRGFLEQRGGPWIDAAHPEQIEVLGRN